MQGTGFAQYSRLTRLSVVTWSISAHFRGGSTNSRWEGEGSDIKAVTSRGLQFWSKTLIKLLEPRGGT